MIIDFLQKNEDVEEMVQQLGGFLTHWLPMFEAENRSYLAVGIGCTGGVTAQSTSSIAWSPHSGAGADLYSGVTGICNDYPEVLVDRRSPKSASA